jgi:hypothetical protein
MCQLARSENDDAFADGGEPEKSNEGSSEMTGKDFGKGYSAETVHGGKSAVGFVLNQHQKKRAPTRKPLRAADSATTTKPTRMPLGVACSVSGPCRRFSYCSF